MQTDLLTTYENQRMSNSENNVSLGIREAAGLMCNPSSRLNSESTYTGYGCPYVPGLEITNNGGLQLENNNCAPQFSQPDCGNNLMPTVQPFCDGQPDTNVGVPQPIPNETFSIAQPNGSTGSSGGDSGSCSDQSVNIPVGENGRTVQASPDGSSASTIVQPNDSLYKIASDMLGNNASQGQIQDLWQQIAQANSINPPYEIQPGQQLDVPNPQSIPAIENGLSNNNNGAGQSADAPNSALTPNACGADSSQPSATSNADTPVTPSSLEQMIKTDIGNGSCEQGYQDLESNISSLSGQDQEALKTQLKSDNLIPELAAGAVQSSMDQSGNSSFSYDDAQGMSKNNPVDKAIANYVQDGNNFAAMGGYGFADPADQQIQPGALSNFESNQAGNLNLPDQAVSSLMQTVKSDMTNGSNETAYQDLESRVSSLTNQEQQTLQSQLTSGNFMPGLAAGAVEYAMDQSGNSSFSMNDAQNLPTGNAIDQAIAQFVQDTSNFSAMAGSDDGSAGGMFTSFGTADAPSDITSDSLQSYESDNAYSDDSQQ